MGQKIEKLLLILIITSAFFFRFYKLSQNPPGLYWDETALGYDAYSVLNTGMDHHGSRLPLFFESFGDWKLPVYFYLLIPSIKIFGLTEFAVRFPSALAGILTVFFLYKILIILTKNTRISLLSSFFLSISPWHIQFSRAGFEANVGLFFLVFGIYFFVRAIEKQKSIIFLLSFFSLVLSMYTYHAYRIFTPLFGISLVLIYKNEIRKNLTKILIPAIIVLLILLPLINFTFSSQGRERALRESAFRRQDFEQAKLDYDQKSKKPLRFLSGYLYEPFLYYPYIAVKQYIEYFSPIFLFFRGDQTGRHSQVDLGQIYSIDLIFLLLAFFTYKSINRRTLILMMAWLLMSPIPAIIVTPNPQALRSLQMSIPLIFFSALGASAILSSKRTFPKTAIAVFLLYSVLIFSHSLFVHYPTKVAPDWQSGYKEMVLQIQNFQDNYENIYVTNINQVPYIYVLFYERYDPEKFIKQNGNRESFDKFHFVNRDVNVYDRGKILYVAPSWEKVDGKWLASVNDFNNKHIYSLWEIGGQN